MPDAFGVVADRDGTKLVAVREGEHAIPLAPLAHAGALGIPTGTFDEPSLNRFLELGRGAWSSVLDRLRGPAGDWAPRLELSGLTPAMPFQVGDFVDCFSSIEHASHVGQLFRPGAEDPLPRAYRHLPLGYHGRAQTVVVSGTPVERPAGVLGPGTYGPEPSLDFELELGFVCGPGRRIRPDDAAEHLFGVVLLNDWSARGIQRFETVPLGPLLGKSFQTSISPWVVPLDALQARRVSGPAQDPEPLPHLRASEDWALDLDLEAEVNGTVVSRVNARGLYWTAAQQLAHVTSNGAWLSAGDLIGSGTVSGEAPGSQGCLLELTKDGAEPLTLDDGSTRAFLEDGDTVVLRGSAGPMHLGEVRGTVLPVR